MWPASCMPTPNPGPSTGWIFAHPARPASTSAAAPRRPVPPAVSKARSTSNSSDPDTLVSWLQGRSEITYRSQKPLQLRGNVSVGPNRFAIDAMKAEIDGGVVDRAHCSLQSSGQRRLPDRCRFEVGTSRPRCRNGVRALGGGSASRVAGRSAAVAGYRPRLVGRPGVATVRSQSSATGRRRSRSIN